MASEVVSRLARDGVGFRASEAGHGLLQLCGLVHPGIVEVEVLRPGEALVARTAANAIGKAKWQVWQLTSSSGRLHEELFGDCETVRLTSHHLVRAVRVPALTRENVMHR